MKELKHMNMSIFKRNTGDVAVQLLVFVVVQMMAKEPEVHVHKEI